MPYKLYVYGIATLLREKGPVFGSIESGDVVPKGLPSTEGQITRKQDVLMPRLGPSKCCHHPGLGSSRLDAA